MRASNVTRVIGSIGEALARGRPPSRPPPVQGPSTTASARSSTSSLPARSPASVGVTGTVGRTPIV